MTFGDSPFVILKKEPVDFYFVGRFPRARLQPLRSVQCLQRVLLCCSLGVTASIQAASSKIHTKNRPFL
ncbi:hypothetical protein BBH88_06475 [Planococcus antarcticus DSM 14505]|uniref:Uncharacterized protein n=1 Tax=Planococcus antarcticus DSM 14505 TaxID=1185653 RepID=A0ABN4RDE5_9BACL|nr:hypothetical protein BBH88_06475 [Planococcus antarcticus DSM 14505]